MTKQLGNFLQMKFGKSVLVENDLASERTSCSCGQRFVRGENSLHRGIAVTAADTAEGATRRRIGLLKSKLKPATRTVPGFH